MRASLVQFSSVTQSSLTLCNCMDRSMPGFPVHYQLPQLAQTRVYWVGDAIQPSSSLPSPSPPAFNLPQHPGLLALHIRWLKYWSFSFSINPSYEYSGLSDRLVGSPCSPRDSQESSPAPQFKSINFSAFSFLHSPTLISIHDHWKNHSLD